MGAPAVVREPPDPLCGLNEGLSKCSVHGDGLSSAQLVTNSSGNQAARIIYGAWGNELYSNDTVPNGLDARFVGGLGVRNDAATGLIYMRHRWYMPEAQRFISRDPLGHLGGSNLYIYPTDPVDFVDPMGLKILMHPSNSPCDNQQFKDILRIINSTPNGNALLTALDASPKHFYLRNADVDSWLEGLAAMTSDPDLKKQAREAKGGPAVTYSQGDTSVSIIDFGRINRGYHPDRNDPYYLLDKVTATAHELAHVLQDQTAQHVRSGNNTGIYKHIGTSDHTYAIYIENLIRSDLGMRCRHGNWR